MSKMQVYIYGLVLVIIILRLPVLYFWDDKLTGDDASLYIETAINFAEGKGYHSSVLRHIEDKDLLLNYIEKNTVIDRMEWIPPLYIICLSAIYKISGPEHFLLLINVFNILLFLIFIYLFLQFLKKQFPNEPLVIILSVFFIGFNSIIFEFTFGAHLEMIYLLTFMLAFLCHIDLLNKATPKIIDYVIYSFTLTLFLFSKYSAIPFVAALLFHHLFRRNYKSFLIISIFTFLMVTPWMFLRSYLISGHPLPALIRGDFPFSESIGRTGFGADWFYAIYSYFRKVSHMLYDYMDIGLFFFLIPFVIVFLLTKKASNNDIRQTGALLFIFAFFFFGFILNNPVRRYQFLLLIPILPFSLSYFLNYLKRQEHIINYKIGLLLIVISFSIIQIYEITEFYNVVRKRGIERSEIINNSLDLVSKAQIEPNDILLVNIEGFNVFSENRVVLTPRNINQVNKSELMEIYGIDYILFAEGERYLPNNIFLDQDLIGVSEGRENIYLYKAIKKED